MTAALLAAMAVAVAFPPTARRRLARVAGREPDRARTVPVPLVAALLAPLVGGVVLGWPWGAVVGLAAAPLVARLVTRLDSAADRRRADQAASQLPTALDLVAASLESGRPVSLALGVVAAVTPDPLGADLAVVAHRLEASGDVRTALDGVPASLAALSRALRRSDETGVPVARVVHGVAADVRRSRSAARRESARRVGVRATAPLGLCFLPAFFLIGIVPTVIALAGTLRI